MNETVTWNEESGSASLYIFMIVLFITSITLGLFLVISRASLAVSRAEKQQETRELLLDSFNRLLALASADPTPDLDSVFDPLWASTTTLDTNGIAVTVEELSSRISPNFVRRELFQKTSLSALFLSGMNANRLQEYREKEGLSMNIEEHYRAFFEPRAFENLLGPYGWANVNTTDEFVLRAIAKLRTGSDARAEELRDKIQTALMAKQVITAESLPSYLGSDYTFLFPVLNAEPPFNVNFVPEAILSALLAYPDYAVKAPESKTALILSERAYRGLNASDLRSLVGEVGSERLFAYLGTRSSFLSVTLAKDGLELFAVLAFIPASPGKNGKREILVSQKRLSP